MSDPLVLSGSSVATFLRCGKQWYYAYVMGIKSPPSVRQAIGTASHEAIALDMSQKVETLEDLPTDELLDAFSDSYEREIYGVEVEPDEESPDQGKDSGVRVMKVAAAEILPKIQPVLVEEPVQFEVNDIPYAGVVDLVDSKGRVRDWKTTKRRPTSGNSYLLQMTGYALAYRQIMEEPEAEVVLDHFVRTKVPYYLPIASGGPISDSAIGSFSSVVRAVHEQIESGNFIPNGLMNNACSWCGYRDICPYYKEYRP